MGNKNSNLNDKECKLQGEKLNWEFGELTDYELKTKLQGLDSSVKVSVLLLSKNNLYKSPNLVPFPQFSTLSWLQLQRNYIGQLEVQNIPKTITWLYVSWNKLEALPNFSGHKALAILWVSHNMVRSVDAKSLPVSLKELDLKSNKLTTVPSLSHLKALEQLDLSENQIKKLAVSELPLSNLQCLNLEKNQIHTIEVSATCSSKSLQEFNLANNQLKSLPHLACFEGLEEIDFSHNDIETLAVSKLPVTKLKCLYLQANQLDTVEDLSPLKTLQVLALHNNRVSDLQGLPESLTDISLAGNPLEQLQKGCFRSAKMFEVINSVPERKRNKFPEFALQKEQIENLRLPPSICFKLGFERVQNYFETGCANIVACEAFKDYLTSQFQLHEGIFEQQQNMCYCENCHTARGDESVYQRGKPAKLYALPIGWYRFGLVADARCKQLQAFENWHRAYHGTSVNNLLKILQVGSLVHAGVKVMGGGVVSEQAGHFNDNWKPEGFNTKKVFVTPSAKYAGLPAYAKVHSFTYGGLDLQAQVMLQVLINPDSYTVSGKTAGTGKIDPYFDNDSLEWSTDEHGSTILYGLLVRVQ